MPHFLRWSVRCPGDTGCFSPIGPGYAPSGCGATCHWIKCFAIFTSAEGVFSIFTELDIHDHWSHVPGRGVVSTSPVSTSIRSKPTLQKCTKTARSPSGTDPLYVHDPAPLSGKSVQHFAGFQVAEGNIEIVCGGRSAERFFHPVSGARTENCIAVPCAQTNSERVRRRSDQRDLRIRFLETFQRDRLQAVPRELQCQGNLQLFPPQVDHLAGLCVPQSEATRASSALHRSPKRNQLNRIHRPGSQLKAVEVREIFSLLSYVDWARTGVELIDIFIYFLVVFHVDI